METGGSFNHNREIKTPQNAGINNREICENILEKSIQINLGDRFVHDLKEQLLLSLPSAQILALNFHFFSLS